MEQEALTGRLARSREGGRALVLGASMAGLLAARVLSETFDHVTVVDRDDLVGTGPRKGVPQGHHSHGILAKGREVLEELFPGLTADLIDVGATPVDVQNDIAWFNGTRPMSRAPSDLLALSLSRPALEDYIRERVRGLSGVELHGGCEAVGLLTTGEHRTIAGVKLIDAAGTYQDCHADLVVDTTGRSNRSMTWLAELGYPHPSEETVRADIAYATRQYVRSKPLPSGLAASINSLSPSYPYSVVLLPLEGDRWIITLIGIGDDIPPVDAKGFEEYARRLPMADLHDVIDHAEPLTEPRRFRVPASVRRRYERLNEVPAGYLVMGDALCAFNPVYGQGMTVAAVEAMVLRDCLNESRDDVPRRFYRQAARFIDVPWDMAAGGDLAVPSTVGKRTMKVRFLNRYIAKVLRAAEVDTVVSLTFHQTVNLTSPPQRLFAPRMLKRVLAPRPAR